MFSFFFNDFTTNTARIHFLLFISFLSKCVNWVYEGYLGINLFSKKKKWTIQDLMNRAYIMRITLCSLSIPFLQVHFLHRTQRFHFIQTQIEWNDNTLYSAADCYHTLLSSGCPCALEYQGISLLSNDPKDILM